jgi:hypothetical protein
VWLLQWILLQYTPKFTINFRFWRWVLPQYAPKFTINFNFWRWQPTSNATFPTNERPAASTNSNAYNFSMNKSTLMGSEVALPLPSLVVEHTLSHPKLNPYNTLRNFGQGPEYMQSASPSSAGSPEEWGPLGVGKTSMQIPSTASIWLRSKVSNAERSFECAGREFGQGAAAQPEIRYQRYTL